MLCIEFCDVNLAKLEGLLHNITEEKCIFSNRPEIYAEDSIETFVWIPLGNVSNTLEKLTDYQIGDMLRDIPGEAG